jgi:acid phosphatase
MHNSVVARLMRAGVAGMAFAVAACSTEAPTVVATPIGAATSVVVGHNNNVPGLERLQHVVVIYLENHSFDNLYGEFPGANGLANAHRAPLQIDLATGLPYVTLPSIASEPFLATLPNAPFNIEQYIPGGTSAFTPDLVHRFYQEQVQIDGGKMDKFATVSDAKGLSMGYYHTMTLALAAEAQRYTLCDNFFHGAFGGSMLNHIWLIAAAPAVFPNAPASVVAQVGANGLPTAGHDGFVTTDGYVINTSFTVNQPHPASTPAANLVPNQTMPTIGDRLTDAGVSWVWYSGGWNDALAGHADPLFQFHHQPFAYFAKYADGTAAKAEHLRDEAEFIAAARAGSLPGVAFVKPLGEVNEHPGYANVLDGERHVEELINAVRNGPNWKNTAIIITYDEHGGFWDHVAPPVVDRWGPGSRVPALIISPFSRGGYVDHTLYETTSILSFIERRWGLKPLGSRDAHANDLTNAFDFQQGNDNTGGR